MMDALDDARSRIATLARENERLLLLLREARQYVSDAGIDEDAEAQKHSTALLARIDVMIRFVSINTFPMPTKPDLNDAASDAWKALQWRRVYDSDDKIIASAIAKLEAAGIGPAKSG